MVKMMKSVYAIVLWVMMSVLLIGCFGEKGEEETDPVVDARLVEEVAKSIDRVIYTSPDFEDMYEEFSKYKNYIEDSVFQKNFDVRDNKVAIRYDFGATSSSYDVKDVIVTYPTEESIIEVFIISEVTYYYEEEYWDYDMHGSREQYIQINRYTFKDGKMVGIKNY